MYLLTPSKLLIHEPFQINLGTHASSSHPQCHLASSTSQLLCVGSLPDKD